jgi:hypothetical protein
MSSEENSAEALAGEESGLRAVEFNLFELLAAFAFKFRFREGGFARKLVDKLQERLGKFGETREANGAVVCSRMRRKIGAEATQVLFDLATRSFCGAGAHNGCSHLSEARGAVCGGGISGA